MEVLPIGDTRFQDIRRRYNNNFFEESIVLTTSRALSVPHAFIELRKINI
ncbi:hypothetical protein OESDEN_21857 [Oesophagostomum dentatum]|uniref:Uncharacterized protein n=1 Tax=Oesophagostomum dentatum TaxID=61180 RepID=A0A0B1S3Q7_OESDE|nr:hypothetical protein OESDEN_21857 [Oesophagostomum dentatum]